MGKRDLQGRRKQILDFVISATQQRGYPPTMREIARALGLASPSTVLYHLRVLEEEGYIQRDPARNRALRPTGAALQAGPLPTYVPLVGRVAAGQPILATENLEGFLPLPAEMFPGEGLFMLRVQGDSMTGAGILEGDYVIVRQQDTAEDGEIVVALLGDEATVKRLYRHPDHVELRPEHPRMASIRTSEVQVLGRVVGMVRSFR